MKSKRYLQKIWLSITLLSVVLLLVTAFSILFTSERTVLNVQQRANEKLLGQIRYNVSQMNEIVADTAQTLFLNNDVKILRYAKTDDELMYQRIDALDTYVGTSSFLHSVFIYNGNMDRFYIGNGNIRAIRPAYEEKFRAMLSEAGQSTKRKLIPVDLGQSDGTFRKVDFFSYLLYDPSAKRGIDDALILNVKSQWLFDNLDLIAKEEGQQTGQAFLMDDDGRILNARNRIDPTVPELAERLHELLAQGETSGYEVIRIGGEKQVVSFMKAGLQDWTLIHAQPYAEVLSQVQRLRYTTILLTVVFLALTVSIAMIISRRLYRPFDQMFRSIVSKTPDELQQTGQSRDEMAVLAGLYGNMIDRVKLADSKIEENKWILKRYTMRRLVQESETMTAAEWETEARGQGLDVRPEGRFTVCVARLDDVAAMSRGPNAGDHRLYHYAISNIAEEIVGRAHAIAVVEPKPDHLVFLVQSREPVEESLIELLEELQSVVKSFYRVTFSVAVGETFQGSRSMSAQYAKTLNQSVYKLFYGKQSIITAEMAAKHERSDDIAIPSDLERRIIEGIRSGNWDALEPSFEKFVELAGTMSYDNCVHALSYLSIVIKRTVAEVNENKLRPIPTTDLYRLHAEVMERETLDEMKAVFAKVLQPLCASRQDEKELDRNALLIDAIKEIVQANYTDLNLSLQSVSDLLKMSSVYVGRLFKKAEGLSIADYITEVRLEQTERLLEKGDYTVNEIMEASGFSNQSHFFRAFKKKFGTTPREYRMKKLLS
ncbi:helix-turn-helix domain-containing protein [Cohnella sp. GCM10027633]|uniref:AraC family transcriptional regulator n=1 Tax=unclassified Cohnella TaxID=2636738 RepID=UPI0036346341